MPNREVLDDFLNSPTNDRMTRVISPMTNPFDDLGGHFSHFLYLFWSFGDYPFRKMGLSPMNKYQEAFGLIEWF